MAAPLPLLIVTRPQPQADEWVARLQALGAPAAALPLLGIAEPADLAPVQQAWRLIAEVPAELSSESPTAAPGGDGPALTLVMFVSPSAVERFFAHRPAGVTWPAGLIAAGTGPGTRAALLQGGVPGAAICTPPDAAAQFDSEALWRELQGRGPWAGRRALIVRGEGGRDWLADALRQHGAVPHFVEAYRRTVPVPDAAGQAVLARALAHPARHCWLFSSSEAVGHLPALAPQADWSAARALATHPRIAGAARALGLPQVRTVSPSPEAVVAALRAAPAPG